MINEGSPELPQVESEVGQLLEDLRDAGSADKHGNDGSNSSEVNAAVLECLVEKFRQLPFYDPRQQYDQLWVHSGVSQLLGYYATNVITTMGNDFTELDLVALYWSILDRCFHGVNMITTRYVCISYNASNRILNTIKGPNMSINCSSS